MRLDEPKRRKNYTGKGHLHHKDKIPLVTYPKPHATSKNRMNSFALQYGYIKTINFRF
jgi:hypothetical protein